jgi:hypothetical protein
VLPGSLLFLRAFNYPGKTNNPLGILTLPMDQSPQAILL